MSKSNLNLSILILLFSVGFIIPSSGQNNTTLSEVSPQTDSQIAEYIRNIYQDKNGNFWFGTNNYGLAHFNGEKLTYFSV